MMRRRPRQDTRTSAAAGKGTAVDVMPLEVAEGLTAERQRRRRLVLWVLAPAIAAGLVLAATQVRLGGGSPSVTPLDRNWETGMRLIQTGETSKGIALLESLLEELAEGPERARAHARLGELYVELGEDQPHYLNSAIRHYTRALHAPVLAEHKDRLLYETGRCFSRLGSHETALEYFEQLCDDYPESPFRPRAFLGVGECYLGIGHYEQARRVLAEAAVVYRDEPLGEEAFFRLADSFLEQAHSLKKE